MPYEPPKFVLDSPAAVAQRFALQSIMPDDSLASWRGRFFSPHSESAAKTLQANWERRITQLREIGYKPFRAKIGFKRASFCPSPLAFTSEFRAPCKSYLICPYCWCRRMVHENFSRILRSIYPKPEAFEPLARSLIQLVTNKRLGTAYSADEVVQMAIRERPCFPPLLSKTHGYSFSSVIEPDCQGWLLQHRVLAVAEDSYSMDDLPENIFLGARVLLDGYGYPVERETIARVVGLTCSYPTGMLFSSVWKALEVLKARSGTRGRSPRLSVYKGIVYSARRPKQRRRA